MVNPASKGRVGLSALADAGIGVAWHDNEWIVADEVAAQAVLDGVDAVGVLRQQAVVAIKAEAARRIELLAPEWRQRNMTARGLELLMLSMQRTLTADEAAEIVAIEAVWMMIKAVRAASNGVEAEVMVMSDIAALESFDAVTHPGWPA